MLEKIREVINTSPFYGEGHRKVWVRLRFAEVRTSKARVLRLMRAAQLLWVKVFRNVEELRCALAELRARYNHRWIVQRLGYLTPTQARQQLLALGAAA